MKKFTTAAKRAEERTGGEQPIEFEIDDQEVKAFRPGDGQLAVFMATSGRHASKPDQIAGALNFFSSTLDKEAQVYVERRLLDREDDFGLEEVQDILEFLIGEWTGRPTEKPSDSTQSPPVDGQNSTLDTPALT